MESQLSLFKDDGKNYDLSKGGVKYDAGKAPWHLVAFDAIAEIVAVLDFGAKKYAARNWEAGMDWDRPFGACLRHLTAWWMGEDKDQETGLSHLAHAGCCIMFLIAYEIRGVGVDTRPDSGYNTLKRKGD